MIDGINKTFEQSTKR